MDKVSHYGELVEVANIAKPEILVGGLLGAMPIFLFSALATRAVGNAAFYLIQDVRDQCRENPQILPGTARPNYSRSVDMVTTAALKEMIHAARAKVMVAKMLASAIPISSFLPLR